MQHVYLTKAERYGDIHIMNAETDEAVEISDSVVQFYGERAIWTEFDGGERQTFIVRGF